MEARSRPGPGSGVGVGRRRDALRQSVSVFKFRRKATPDATLLAAVLLAVICMLPREGLSSEEVDKTKLENRCPILCSSVLAKKASDNFFTPEFLGQYLINKLLTIMFLLLPS
jgi:hypothetical protein